MADHKDAPKSFTKDVVFRSKFINEALEQGLKFGSNQFRVYHQLRWFEEEGDYEWNVASYKTLGEYINISEKEVRVALDKLRCANVVQHILTDKRWYRAKTDLWATTIALKERGIEYGNMQILDKGKLPELPESSPKSEESSPKSEESSPKSEESSPKSEEATPVFTGVGNIYKNNKRNMSSLADASSDLSIQQSSPAIAGSDNSSKEKEQSPFDEDIDEANEVSVVNVKNERKLKNERTRAAAALANEIAVMLGRDRRQVSDAVVKNMRSLLNEFSRDEIIHMANWCKEQEFWQDKTLLQMIKKDTVNQSLMNKTKGKYEW